MLDFNVNFCQHPLNKRIIFLLSIKINRKKKNLFPLYKIYPPQVYLLRQKIYKMTIREIILGKTFILSSNIIF
jgi:hypothetical protein